MSLRMVSGGDPVNLIFKGHHQGSPHRIVATESSCDEMVNLVNLLLPSLAYVRTHVRAHAGA